MKTFFIDLENVKNQGFIGVDRLDAQDRVFVFYSDGANSLNIPTIQMINRSKATIDYVPLMRSGHNAMDFQIVGLLGFLIGSERKGYYAVISQDRGYLAPVDFFMDHSADVLDIQVAVASNIGEALNRWANQTGRKKKQRSLMNQEKLLAESFSQETELSAAENDLPQTTEESVDTFPEDLDDSRTDSLLAADPDEKSVSEQSSEPSDPDQPDLDESGADQSPFDQPASYPTDFDRPSVDESGDYLVGEFTQAEIEEIDSAVFSEMMENEAFASAMDREEEQPEKSVESLTEIPTSQTPEKSISQELEKTTSQETEKTTSQEAEKSEVIPEQVRKAAEKESREELDQVMTAVLTEKKDKSAKKGASKKKAASDKKQEAEKDNSEKKGASDKKQEVEPKESSEKKKDPAPKKKNTNSQKNKAGKKENASAKESVTVHEILNNLLDPAQLEQKEEMIVEALKSTAGKNDFYQFFVHKMGKERGGNLYRSIREEYQHLLRAVGVTKDDNGEKKEEPSETKVQE